MLLRKKPPPSIGQKTCGLYCFQWRCRHHLLCFAHQFALKRWRTQKDKTDKVVWTTSDRHQIQDPGKTLRLRSDQRREEMWERGEGSAHSFAGSQCWGWRGGEVEVKSFTLSGKRLNPAVYQPRCVRVSASNAELESEKRSIWRWTFTECSCSSGHRAYSVTLHISVQWKVLSVDIYHVHTSVKMFALVVSVSFCSTQ